MEQPDFDSALPAIWLVFGGTFLNHQNAPVLAPDRREQSLVDLLRSYLESGAGESCDATQRILSDIINLLNLWSEDLNLIYSIRDNPLNEEKELLAKNLAKRFLLRVQSFNDCTIIPNGLISAHHCHKIMKEVEGYHDHVSLAILKKRTDSIDWTQVNPGSRFHQRCPTLSGDIRNAVLEITGVKLPNLTTDWLFLLVGLKAIEPKGVNFYQEESLYEILLAHLNGKTAFESNADEGFVPHSCISPTHTWQVVEQSFRCLLKHFLGDTYLAVFNRLLTSFKFFLVEKTFSDYQSKPTQWCHFLLEEQIRDIARQALDKGTEEQKAYSITLIDAIKEALDQHCSEQAFLVSQQSQLEGASVSSLSFPAPCLTKLSPSPSILPSPSLLIEPTFSKPTDQVDIIDYLQDFKINFVEKFRSSRNLSDIALLIYGIEVFFVEYLARTNILQISNRTSFSSDDTYLAKMLLELAVVYFNRQTRLVLQYLPLLTYQPQLCAKNIVIQFFVYAAVAALNFRDKRVGPLLATHNLSVSSSLSSLNEIIPHLVLQDASWLKVLFALKAFFKPEQEKKTLFSPKKFRGSSFIYQVTGNAQLEDIDVAFAYSLIETDSSALSRFNLHYSHLEKENFCQKWRTLAYTDKYLPSIYLSLSKIAHFVKVSLAGFPEKLEKSPERMNWSLQKTAHRMQFCGWKEKQLTAAFKINSHPACDNPSRFLTSYLLSFTLKERDAYQRLIIDESNVCTSHSHLKENEILASQDQKPLSMDRVRYLQLGFVQSEPYVKLERLYIAIKDAQLDFNSEEESVLIKQTLFEVGAVIKTGSGFASLLEWTSDYNPVLVHKLGLLCIKKALVMRHRLTQHHALGHILEVMLGLLTLYPTAHKKEFVKGFMDIYSFLKETLTLPPSHLSDLTLLHLNAYLIISMQALPLIPDSEILIVLKALLAIQKYKAKGLSLPHDILLRVHMASFTLGSRIEYCLKQDQNLLNDLMASVIQEWDRTSTWRKSKLGLLFTCKDYAVKPLGGIYFKDRPIMGLPDSILGHEAFKEYLGTASFAVVHGSRVMNKQEVPCYHLVDTSPQIRLTLVEDGLLIEELIGIDYQQYIPVAELFDDQIHPCFLSQSPDAKEAFTHWLSNQKILVKDRSRKVLYEWDLKSNRLFSTQHQNYVIPVEQLESSPFKSWLERIESSDWIEIIAQPTVDNLVQFIALNFPRLGLHFELRNETFCCKEIHGYFLAETQHINTLHGFRDYTVLEKKELNSFRKFTKVVIPHRQLKLNGSFYEMTVVADQAEVHSPTYFVYDYDEKTGFLKAHHSRARLYLAILYYCSASLDEHDLANIISYQLAKELLEGCWIDKPFDEIELNIIDQFLSPEMMRDLHSHRIALYLKVYALLSSSLHLAFLHTDDASVQSKKKSKILLRQCDKYLPYLLSQYLGNKATIFAAIRLSREEEEEILKRCVSSFKEYQLLHFKKKPEVVLSAGPTESYIDHYRQLFSRDALENTSFMDIFMKHYLKFRFDQPKQVNFLSGFHAMLSDGFCVDNFISLFKLAKSCIVTRSKYRYMLHHMVYKSKIHANEVPSEVGMMLARALLLVNENPVLFPESPNWYGVKEHSIKMHIRSINKTEIMNFLRPYQFGSLETKTYIEEENENVRIWSNLKIYNLDKQGVPLSLPENLNNFRLLYENYASIENRAKRDHVRQLYLEAALNNSMYQFFLSVMELCDQHKRNSPAGQRIFSIIDNPITVTVNAESPSTPILTPVSWEKWAIPPKPLIALDTYFQANLKAPGNTDFLFETELREHENEYQRDFLEELKNSWFAHHSAAEFSYWPMKHPNELLSILKAEYVKTSEEAQQIWGHIVAQLKLRPNSELDHFFALRWHSGQVSHFHKGDILRILVEPHKLADYNPDCIKDQDSIIQSLLRYVKCEIITAKISRALTYIEQFKTAGSEVEQFSVVQSLVSCLKEDLSPASYKYPQWLLFQFENELIIRVNQQELIEAMLNETEKVMYQLNMGEGKSSVILPLLCSNLTNSQQIVRVLTVPALLVTMEKFLRQCFSGLIRKHVYTLPFSRETDISPENLKLILEALQKCQKERHIIIISPEHRLCLNLKVRELLLENQQQLGAKGIFDWETYRQRVPSRTDVYSDLTQLEIEKLLKKQDKELKNYLKEEEYLDKSNVILKVPPCGQGSTVLAQFKETTNDPIYKEYSCLKAAYLELLYNSKEAHMDSSEKLTLLNKINSIPAIDLLDESDEILRHGTELNYTIGEKCVLDGGELRWQIPEFFIQTIFSDPELLNVITAGKANGYTVINLHYSQRGGVPFIQFLDEAFYTSHIKPLLTQKFFSENLLTFRKYNMTADRCEIEGEMYSLRSYVDGSLAPDTEKKVKTYLADKGQLKEKLLIAKGWLSHGILFHVFHAKYRIQYGLNLNAHNERQIMKLVAVPFLGKDTPSQRSEFSHPDVMLGFTILSYMYQGLNEEQLKKALVELKEVFCSQVADAKLQEWAEASQAWILTLTNVFSPPQLTSLKNVDLTDKQCITEMHKYLSGSYLAILFYINQFIFSQDAMQYRNKIGADAHSLVGYNAALGFSGTDDRKLTMPHQVKSLRSASQEGTNGKLLDVLTQERNSSYFTLEGEDTNSYLHQLCLYVERQSHCHALIDAGAVIAGLTNHETASFLLSKLPSNILGVMYFSDQGNSLSVLTRDGKIGLLQDCYLDKQNLFAYLDDIHTRGTDVKLPLNCHAILTTSIGMQKDKLMQAAMRLRQLAQKQSVSLWGTQAVTFAIARDNSVEVSKINSFEVLKWVTRNTINGINADLFPVAVRKVNFQFTKLAEEWLKEAPAALASLAEHCQVEELFWLEDFYALTPQCLDLSDQLYCLAHARIKAFWQELEKELRLKNLSDTAFYKKVTSPSIKRSFRKELDAICGESATFLQTGYVRSSFDEDEEKENEVEVEAIEEQEDLIEIVKGDPLLESKWDVKLILQQDFIKQAEEKRIIMPIKAVKRYIQMPAGMKNIIWHPDIFMTKNFMCGVEARKNKGYDNYLRPVDIILIHRLEDSSKVILLSGQEASRIKRKCFLSLDENNLLVHLHDIDGSTQLPTECRVAKDEQKLLTIVKLFSGECHYEPSEVPRLAKRVGRLYPEYFTRPKFSSGNNSPQDLYGLLIEKGYLDFSGTMTEKLFQLLEQVKSGEAPTSKLLTNNPQVLKKLYQIYEKLIVRPSKSMRYNHTILSRWVRARGKSSEYAGSVLESILTLEQVQTSTLKR